MGKFALIVTSLERGWDLKGIPIRILAAAQGGNPGWHAGIMGTGIFAPWATNPSTSGGRRGEPYQASSRISRTSRGLLMGRGFIRTGS